MQGHIYVKTIVTIPLNVPAADRHADTCGTDTDDTKTDEAAVKKREKRLS